MEMENNPVDKLFAEKLRYLDKAPNADVWSRIQGRKQEKKRGAFWWINIAACLLLLLVSGGLSWWRFSPDKGEAITHEIASASSTPKVVLPAITPTIAAKQPAIKGTVVKEKIVRKHKAQLKARTHQVPQPELTAENTETSPLENQSRISAVDVATIAETQTTVLVMNIAEPSGKMGNLPPKSDSTPNLHGSKVSVDADENLPVAEGKKKTRAGKILRQLKHIKNGEKIEWSEIGIHPENLLALVKPDRTNKNNSSK